MEEQHRLCPAGWCGSGAWLAQRAAPVPDVWHVTHVIDSGAWTIAAPDPLCPHCGTTLVTTLELEGGFGGNKILEPGKLLDWLRTL